MKEHKGERVGDQKGRRVKGQEGERVRGCERRREQLREDSLGHVADTSVAICGYICINFCGH